MREIKFTIYLKSGSKISGLSSDYVESIRNAKRSTINAVNSFQWFVDGRDKTWFMINENQIEAIFPEHDNSHS